ncbi:SIR2 family protein [Microbacterium enclense]|uniref:SIR2 family protein n=1 Tax=Microbacterium enclense TaxID=993073 RepID=UPI0036D98544
MSTTTEQADEANHRVDTSPPAVAPNPEEELANVFGAMLAEHHDALPYLFIGSGFSRRYIGLPDWEGLLRVFAEEIGENFNYHLASANGNYPLAASSVAEAFHPHWWKDNRYATQVLAHQDEAKTHKHGALKVAIAEYVEAHQDLTTGRPGVDNDALAAEIESLRRVVVDGVITTNYDSLTDQLFPTFQAYVGQEELMFSDAQFIGETYKIHGSAERPQSLILTADDYQDFSERNHYLAAKLLTIFAEHPVLFVGYSLNDEYLGEILGNIATAVGPNRLDELGARIYFVEWNADEAVEPVIEKANLERGGHRLPITRIETNSFTWLWDALGQLERPFPAGVLRQLRKHVFDLVTHPDPSDSRETVRAIPIDAEGAQDVRVVFGVGQFSEVDLEELSSISARTLTRADLEQDVLGIRERPLDAEHVLRHGIPEQIRPKSSATVPVRKYLREAGRVDAAGNIDYSDLRPIIKQLAERPIQSHSQQIIDRYRREIQGVLTTPRAVMSADLAPYFRLECLLLLDDATLDLSEFRDVLVEFYRSAEFTAQASYFRKALLRYDRLRTAEHGTV